MSDNKIVDESEEERKFQYVMSLDTELPDEHCVTSVTFDISRYGEHTRTIDFVGPVHPIHAIEVVEQYLSVKATWEYYSAIKDDVIEDDYDPATLLADDRLRGDFLSDAHFLERADIDGKGNMVLQCGS